MIKEEDDTDAELLVNACLIMEETNELSETNSNNFLKCELCHQFMQSPDLRSLHYVLNHGCSICSVCSQVSITMNSFKIHVRSNHSQFPCDLCDTLFLTYGELLKHRNNFHDLFKCPLCPFEFFSESHVDTHLFKFHRISVTTFLLTHNYVAEWSDSNQTYYCTMCGVKKCKIDVFSHFLDYHQISLLPLAQKFMSQNLNIRVIGVDSENDCQFTQNVSFCKGCSEHVSEDVPSSAHKFICLGDIICKICFKSQDSSVSRDSHITKEHKNYPCVLGCSNRIVFDVEGKLYEHCLTVHDVKPCHLCGSYIRCADGLMKQHLQTFHFYDRSEEILLSDSIFNVLCGNMTVCLICSLCDFDAVIQIGGVADLFKHLNYHSVSLQAAFHFLEKNNVHQTVYLRLKELRHLDAQKISIHIDGSEPNSDEFSHLFFTENINNVSSNTQTTHSYPDSEYSIVSNAQNPQINVSQTDRSIEIDLGKEPNVNLETNGKSPLNDSDGLDFNNVKCSDGKNITNTVNGLENNFLHCKEKFVSEMMLPGSSSIKTEDLVEFEDTGVPRIEPLPNCSEQNLTSELKEESNPVEDGKRGIDELNSSAKTTVNNLVDGNERRCTLSIDVDSEDCVKSEREDDIRSANKIFNTEGTSDVQMAKKGYSNMKSENDNNQDNSQNNMLLDILNINPVIDPYEVECVVTDTSDIESDSEIPMTEEAKVHSACSSQDMQSSIPKTLPGLNRMEVKTNGFTCEVCCGKFEPHEGIRELLKHMRSLHGFSCNFRGSQLSATFKFNRTKSGSSTNMQRGLVCPECLSAWKSKRLLRKHFSSNHGLNCLDVQPSGTMSYHCRFCKASFWMFKECYAHEKDIHSDQTAYKCHVCNNVEFRKVVLNKHLKRAHPLEKLHSWVSFRCKRCSKLYPTYRLLERHVRVRHPSCMLFRCPHCYSTLRNKKKIVDHIEKEHTANKEHECDRCGRILFSKKALATHKTLKHDKPMKYTYKCRLCKKPFESKDLREAHYKAEHAKEKRYRCVLCDKQFGSKSGLHSHKQVHDVRTDAYKCEHCDKSFTRRDCFTEHLQIHTDARHTCPECGKEFVQRSNMTRHLRIHKGEKPYKCTYCDKTFSDKGACNSHIRVHTKEDVCKCYHCDKTFTRKQKLKYHMKKHTGKGLFNCKDCGKSFTHNFTLKKHITAGKCQRNVEPHGYSCQMCKKTFANEGIAKKHLISHATYKTLQCTICENYYTTMSSLKKHLTNIHKLSSEDSEFKSTLKKSEELIKSRKEINFESVMISVPISQLKKNKKSKKKDTKNQSKKKPVKEAKDEESVSSIGKRVLRNTRKSRPICLVELDAEDETSDDDQL